MARKGGERIYHESFHKNKADIEPLLLSRGLFPWTRYHIVEIIVLVYPLFKEGGGFPLVPSSRPVKPSSVVKIFRLEIKKIRRNDLIRSNAAVSGSNIF